MKNIHMGSLQPMSFWFAISSTNRTVIMALSQVYILIASVLTKRRFYLKLFTSLPLHNSKLLYLVYEAFFNLALLLSVVFYFTTLSIVVWSSVRFA